MIRIPKLMGGDDGPMVGTAAGFDFGGIEIIITAPNRTMLQRFCSTAGIELKDNVYDVMLAPMDRVEVVESPGLGSSGPEKGRVH